MKNGGDSFIGQFTTYKECENYLELHFSHLDASTNKIFSPNDVRCGLVPGLHLTANALKRLIVSFDKGWINDDMVNHVVSLLNF